MSLFSLLSTNFRTFANHEIFNSINSRAKKSKFSLDLKFPQMNTLHLPDSTFSTCTKCLTIQLYTVESQVMSVHLDPLDILRFCNGTVCQRKAPDLWQVSADSLKPDIYHPLFSLYGKVCKNSSIPESPLFPWVYYCF